MTLGGSFAQGGEKGLACAWHESCCAMEEAEEPEPMATARLAQRPCALYSCGVSALTVARRAYHRVEHLGGPVGALAKKLASWVVPILYPLEQRWLCLLSFADGYVLAVENAVVSVFPSAAQLFGLLDELAMLSEGLPKMFDDAADHLPVMIRRAPLVGWVSSELGEGWKLLASVWEHGRAGDQEREIGVDTLGDERPAVEGAVEGESTVHALREPHREAVPPLRPLLNSLDDAAKRPADGAGAEGTQPEGAVLVKDPILDLFEGGWCMHRR